MEKPELTTPAPSEKPSEIAVFIRELRQWWSFTNGQAHSHSWHDREDFIAKKLPSLVSMLTAAAVRAERERCAKIAVMYAQPVHAAVVDERKRAAYKRAGYEISAAIRAVQPPKECE